MFHKLKAKVKKFRREIVPVYYALHDKRTPMLAKLLAGLTVIYLLSPVDLIPDFIPVLGLLDDLIIVPLLISATLKLIPPPVIEEIRAKIDMKQKLPQRWYYALPVVALYAYLLFLVARYFFRH
ncbi:YkvA family protein [Niabella aurantiaca]|uniref:YkvA family protein n=1 Tax=Niabella aurantiaca TaxID=379900 RepID=UPI00036857FD|nr:YkvA family protein [Niabella aurantiaca]